MASTEDSGVRSVPDEASLMTRATHADHYLNINTDISPPIHLSTTFSYASKASDLIPLAELDHPSSAGHFYSRYTNPNSTRIESILTSLLRGRALTYSSGLSAFHAALVLLNPKHISIGPGYDGCHHVISIMSRLTGLKKIPLDCAVDDLQVGDIVHVETPLNPTGEAIDIKAYADKAHSRGAYLMVDATFAPPPLQNPFTLGADIVMHSGTKYIGGHSDMLCGVLAISDRHAEWFERLHQDRRYLGNVMGNLEAWLGVRSLRTLGLRVCSQSQSATRLVEWLNGCLQPEGDRLAGAAVVRKVLERVQHASLQNQEWLKVQMPNGFGPVFAIHMKNESLARRLPEKLDYFAHATSLGGVESLIEWRAMSDVNVSRSLLRLSIGLEGWEDLQSDLIKGFKLLVEEDKLRHGKYQVD
ncbi:Cys/Met metabolism PLP-dependent enzyme-domain-containing protein [Xylogone sp. PMI_703]|nr:Cys/Met metabolism PLP-dependent enzyme-domain-containing protein [Xylogone sp. PMI_703]